MADKGQPHAAAVGARRRPVGKGARGPSRPFRAVTLAVKLPAQQVPPVLRRDTVGIEKALSVEMIGRRPRKGLGVASGHACPIGAEIGSFARNLPSRTTAVFAGVSLTFCGF